MAEKSKHLFETKSQNNLMHKITKLAVLFAVIITLLLALTKISMVLSLFITPIASALTVMTAILLWKNKKITRTDFSDTILLIGFIIFTQGVTLNLSTEQIIQENITFVNEFISHAMLFTGILIIVLGVILFSEIQPKTNEKEKIKFIDYYILGFLSAFFGGLFAFSSIEGNVAVAGGIIITSLWGAIGLYIKRRMFGKNHLFNLFITVSSGSYIAVILAYLAAKNLFPLA